MAISSGYAELIFSVFAQGYPAPEKKNACGSVRDDGMMITVVGRDTSMIEKVAAGDAGRLGISNGVRDAG